MEHFRQRVLAHVEHVRKVGSHCTTEETTKQALILPLLDILGFSPFDPTKVRAEHASDFPGAKHGERVDYALFSNSVPVMFVEAKAYSANLTNHCPQLSRYFNATPEVTMSAITNGREWRFFTDLVHKNIMDERPFLTLHLDNPADDVAEQLLRFHHDQFQPDVLRALAEESIYLASFRDAITATLRDCDLDFVRYIATKAGIQRTFTQRFLESVQPIVKNAVARSISGMVATSLNVPVAAAEPAPQAEPAIDPDAPQIDPTNAKIVTTSTERRLLEICLDVLSGEDLQGKDNEAYYTVLYQGKTNRWLFRYWGDKKRPALQFIVPLTDVHRSEIARSGLEVTQNDSVILEKPDHLLRLIGLLRDSLAFCQDHENFRRKAEQATE